MSQYQAFLDEVLEAEEEYPEIVDLLSRYETLHAANADLIQRQDLAGKENEEERHYLQSYIREKTDEILGQNNLPNFRRHQKPQQPRLWRYKR